MQIETPQALGRLEEIASVEGVDSIFLGPGDLSGAMGHVGQLMHPEVVAAMEDATRRAHAVGKPVGSVGGTPEAVARYREMGMDYVACASDIAFLMRHAAATLQGMRAASALVCAVSRDHSA